MANFDFTNRDFTNIKSSLLRRASRVVPDWTVRDPSDFGMLLVDLWAQMGDVLHHYVDLAAGEAFLPTATQRESIMAYAALFGYRPAGRVSATGTVTLSNSTASPVLIPAYTTFVAKEGDTLLYFYVTAPTYVPGNSLGTAVSVSEGTVVSDETLTTSASGSADQRYTLAYRGAVESSIQVSVYEDGVNPTRYHIVDRLVEAAIGERAFRIKYSATEATEVTFGSYLFGAVPEAGVKITASYVYGNGSIGNITANSVVGFGGTAPQGISIVSSSAMNGGTDAEPISALRKRIAANLVPQGRAVTLNDHIVIARQISGVSKATAYYTAASAGASANASVTVLPQEDRTYDFLSSSDTSQTVSSSISDAIADTFAKKKMLGVDVVCAPSISWEQIYIEVDVYSSQYAYSNDVKTAVESAISSIFDFNSVTFGQRITLSELYRAILAVRDVDYAIVTAFNSDDLGGVENVITVDSLSLPKLTFGSPGSDTLAVTVIGGISA